MDLIKFIIRLHKDEMDIPEILLNMLKFGVEAISSILSYANEEDVFLLIDKMIMDQEYTLLDVVQINPDFQFTKITTHILSFCLKTNSNMFSLDETYFEESYKAVNRKNLLVIRQNCLMIPSADNFTH
jgi:hypothetical protein